MPNFIETCNSHSQTNLVKRLNFRLKAQFLEITLYFTGLLLMKSWTLIGTNILLPHNAECIIKKFIETCNFHYKNSVF
jgi:hypothetical protein